MLSCSFLNSIYCRFHGVSLEKRKGKKEKEKKKKEQQRDKVAETIEACVFCCKERPKIKKDLKKKTSKN